MTRDGAHLVALARAFVEPRLAGVHRAGGEPAFDHAQATAEILQEALAPPALVAASYLAEWAQPQGDALLDETLRDFGSEVAGLVTGARQLTQLEALARQRVPSAAAGDAQRQERVRRMMMAFSHDLRGILLHLASRLQSMRWHAASGVAYAVDDANDALELLAPLANRLGVWSLKWEIEDLAFRFTDPQAYAQVAGLVDAKRSQRERDVERLKADLLSMLRASGVKGDVHGRAKHLYSIWKKMRGKHLSIENVFDLRALRVIVDDVGACYGVLARVHERWRAVDGEYDDYIARPKANGYQSLHTVVMDDDRRPVEVQIRTRAMHEHAEHGVAAHWAYKEAGSRGYAGAVASSTDAARVAQARRAMLNQLLAWERDVAPSDAATLPQRVYVFTPQGAVVDLPAGATPLDFAYSLHTTLGHRCRGAKVDGALVPLGTPLRHGQTVELTVAKEGGPSLDWLNPELHFLASPRARSKVRGWFNAQAQQQTMARGRERLERLLQRLGRTAVKHQELAQRVQMADADALYFALGKDEMPARTIETALAEAPSDSAQPDDREVAAVVPRRSAPAKRTHDDVLVVGVGSLLTGLARCCRPAPPDAIGGFITRHKGVAIHRRNCDNFQHMAAQSPQRVCAVAWGESHGRAEGARYAVDVAIEAQDRPGLLRDITEVFAKERVNVSGVQSQTVRGAGDRTAWMTFTVEVADASALAGVLSQVARVAGVRQARRK